MYTNASQPLSIPVGALVAGPCRLKQSAPVLLVYALPRCALGITMLANRAANTATSCRLREKCQQELYPALSEPPTVLGWRFTSGDDADNTRTTTSTHSTVWPEARPVLL